MVTGEIDTEIDEGPPVIEVKWKICNFFSLSGKMDRAVESPTFTFMNATWHIRMYTNGERKYNSLGWMGMYLMRDNSKVVSHNFICLFGIRERNGDDEYVSKTCDYTFSENGDGFGYPKLVQRSTLLKDRSQIESEGSATLFCIIYSSVGETEEAGCQTTEAVIQATEAASQTTQVMSHTTESASQTSQAVPHTAEAASQTTVAASRTAKLTSQTTYPKTSGFEKLSQDFMDLLLNSEDGDIVLKVQEEEYKVHQTILKARSPVFRAMFGHDMQEANSGVVDITDCNPVAFPDFLHYLYSGQVEELSLSKVFDLYVVADKYDIAELKSKCVAFMMNNMCVDAFFDAITLALRYSEPELLEHATSFFVDKAPEIIMMTDWLSFLKEHRVEANELYIKALKCKNSK